MVLETIRLFFSRIPADLPYGPQGVLRAFYPGCRGSAPTDAPHTRWRRVGPGTGRTATGGSASGPAITPDNRFSVRRRTASRRSTISAALYAKGFRRSRARIFELEASSINLRHSCACAAVSDSQARSSGSNSRPSGVTSRPALNEKPAQGPVRFRSRTIRLHAATGSGGEARAVPATPSGV